MSSKDILIKQIKTLDISELTVENLARLEFGESIKVVQFKGVIKK